LTPREEILADDGRRHGFFRLALPLLAIAFIGFLTVGIPLPILPIQVHEALGFGTVTVGITIGLQSLATVATRQYAGRLCDSQGPRAAVLLGLPVGSLAGATYLVAALAPGGRIAGLAILLAGRVLLGISESLFLTGTLTWGIGRVGPQHTGRMMAWQGIAIYAALGLGAPMGIAGLHNLGFSGVAVIAMLLPLAALSIGFALPAVAPVPGRRSSFLGMLSEVWQAGLALALATTGFGAIASFLALYYSVRGWPGAGLGFAAFALGYIIVRLFFAGLPDRLGGIAVTVVSLLIEMLGQVILWLAGRAGWALTGAFLSGAGYSLIFPALGVEVMRRVSPQNRGLAVGAYIAFFDIGFALAGPVTGAIAAWFGYPAAFLAGALAAGAAIGLALSAATGNRLKAGPY